MVAADYDRRLSHGGSAKRCPDLDLLGTGTACLVWSSPLPGQASAPLLYVDLMGGQKPHLLTSVRNNLGAETRVTYAPSTRFYLADKTAGRPWVTRLPFPVQVVERTEIIDWIGRNRLVTRYAYHHGYFDGYEREFRGFGMVEQWDTEEYRADTSFNDGEFVNWDQQSWSPPMLTRSWFHTGAFQQAASVTQQYQSEYWTEPALSAADAAAMRLPDTVLPDGLDPYEVQEAYRALKGRALRVEVYAEDGSAAAGNPYTLTESNFTILCLQKMRTNRHAAFFVHPRETVTFHYERFAHDPRVTYEVVLEIDSYGNPKRSVAIGYPRRSGQTPPALNLAAPAQMAPTYDQMLAYDQMRLHVRASEQQYTIAIDDPDSYRAPLPSASNIAEITGAMPSVKGNGITNLFSFDELDGHDEHDGLWQRAWSGAYDIPYEAIPASDIEGAEMPATAGAGAPATAGAGAPATALTRRLIAQSRTPYRSHDLTALLPQGQSGTLALAGQSYKAALTPGLLSGISGLLSEAFGTLDLAAILTEGGYVQLAGEKGWWMPSGRIYLSPGDSDTPAQELETAKAQFFLPRRAIDPFGGISRVDYDAYALLPSATTDPVKNVTAVVNRVLKPATVTDPNGNQTAVAFDAFGLVTATAVSGKATETRGDKLTGFTVDLDEALIETQFADPLAGPATLLGNATTRILYDFSAYQRTSSTAQPSPPAAYVLARETHVADLGVGGAPAATQYQYALTYSDGFGREIQHKVPRSSRPAGPAPAGPSSTSKATPFANTSRSSRRPAPSSSRGRQGSARCCSTTQRAGSSPRCIPTTRGRRSSSTPGSRKAGTPMTRC
jgi:YD repeat-containing protein